jgi:hypothetical protein
MELARAVRKLLRHPGPLALGALVAVIASVFSVYHLDGGTLKARSLQYSAATTQVLVDSEPSVLGNVAQSAEALSARAQVYANFMASPAILDIIGQQVGLSGGQLYASGPVNASEPRVEQEPTALKRNVEITGETKPYRLNYEAQGNLPTITIYSQAPTTGQAVALANAAVVGLQRYVANVESATGISQRSRVVIRQLGPASGGVVDGGISKTLAVMVFVAVFLLWCVLMLVVARFRAIWRESASPLAEGDGGRNEPAGSGEHEEETAVHAPHNGHAHVPESALRHAPAGREDGRAAPVPTRSAG